MNNGLVLLSVAVIFRNWKYGKFVDFD